MLVTQYCINFFFLQVCFKKAIFALLPRMVFGLYYNTPLVRHLLNYIFEHLKLMLSQEVEKTMLRCSHLEGFQCSVKLTILMKRKQCMMLVSADRVAWYSR